MSLFVTNHLVIPHFSICQFDYHARQGCSWVKRGQKPPGKQVTNLGEIQHRKLFRTVISPWAYFRKTGRKLLIGKNFDCHNVLGLKR